jgi:hypothetical protein
VGGDHLDPKHLQGLLDRGGSVDLVSHNQDRNQSWNNNPGLFGLKITRDLARAFLLKAELAFLLPVFLDGSGNNNHNVCGPFCHFAGFLSLIDLKIQFIRLIDRALPHMHY